MGRTKSNPPKKSARARLAEQYGLKGGNANIWLTVCPRTGQEIGFLGDLRIEHFYACEGDPAVRQATYNLTPMSVELGGERVEVGFDARVELQDGSIEYRVVGNAPELADEGELQARAHAAVRLGGVYRAISAKELNRLAMRVSNWRRALRQLRACFYFPSGEIEAAIVARLTQDRFLTVGEILSAFAGKDSALVLGAIVRLLHRRTVHADLDHSPWCMHTKVALDEGVP